MSDSDREKPRPPYLFMAVLALAALFYALLLNDGFRFKSGGGDAVLSASFAIIYDVLAVWVALAALLVIAAVKGAMPVSGRVAAVVLTPASGAATAAAIDLATRGGRWALVLPCLLPPLIALYAAWARLPRLRAAASAGVATAAIWGAVLVLSAAAGYAAM